MGWIDAPGFPCVLSLATIPEVRSRTVTAPIGAWTGGRRATGLAYNEHGIEGLINATSPGRPPKFSADHKAEIQSPSREGSQS
jgi:hypothetical protein